MSQRDLVAELRGSRIAAPAELRAHVRSIAAAGAPASSNRFTWRRALVVALPAAAAIAAVLVVTRPDDNQTAVSGASDQATVRAEKSLAAPPIAQSGSVGGATRLAPQATPGRIQQYGAYLALRVPTPNGVSDGVKRALRIATSLGGYPTSVHASSHGKAASADLTLKVPRTHVQAAITRLSALGTITSEQVDVQDVQAGLNATDRTIARLQSRLATLRAAEQTDEVKATIAALTARIQRLQRDEAAKIRAAHFATISLHLQTPAQAAPVHHGHGPLHGLGVALRWIGIGAVYVLVLGLPLVVLVALGWWTVRALRRRRENELLAQS
jgi:Domain of unknown function (DUF4349)